ncbi:MAG TPA: hypothetical protein GXX20_02920 [Clostridiaceae bacterium]|nr:hypothetical protein [Clostridiaceae bacterium]
MKKKVLLIGFIVLLIIFTFTGCVPGDGTYTSSNPAGFFWGIWHGWIAPISLIIGLFKDNVRVYEVMNTGWWYDFGFYIAIISGFGGISLTRKKSSNKK